MRKFTLNDITPPKPTLPNNPVNRVIFVLDRSGSMRHLFGQTTTDVQNKIQQLADSDKETGQTSLISIWEFDNVAKLTLGEKPAKECEYFQPRGFGGGTALNDTICAVIDYGLGLRKVSSDEAVLLLVLTDGGECSSTKRGLGDVLASIAKLPENWTVTLIGPQANMKWGENVGIPSDNMLFWDGRAETFGQTTQAQATGMSSYVKTRSAGGSSTQSFYSVNPNKILPEEVEKLIKLPSSDFKILEAPDNFDPGKTSRTTELAPMVRSYNLVFKTGVNYYELIKRETIQENKDLLIYDPSTGAVYGKGNSGEDIRRALGLPTTGAIKVHPVMGKYRIFVQSNSNNRKMLSWKDKTTGNIIRQKLIVLL